ncbi:Plasminogen -like protein [Trichinella zimbabwensis]|uniref:Plasminogen-like protein n=1 Tax=Trichinella zimbabwensis TaxID=268475 RepID=A0A0V1HR11_9BILA|nr:Plasminogen -like protein [Trichinella zimbabwensis]
MKKNQRSGQSFHNKQLVILLKTILLRTVMKPGTIIITIWLAAFGLTAVLSLQCGQPAIKPHTSRIVGGRDAIPYSWPWQVAVYEKRGRLIKFACGASIISDQWLLSAGHCFHNRAHVSGYLFYMGTFLRYEKQALVIQSSQVLVHPLYNMKTMEYDVALIKLKRRIPFSNKVLPVCLPSARNYYPPINATAFVTGWGRTTNSYGSMRLQQVDVTIIEAKKCKSMYHSLYGTVNTNLMFCAGHESGGKDSCQGDSGGPLVLYDTETDKWFQYGIVSWGYGCAYPNTPGVYTIISSHLDWIEATTEMYVPAKPTLDNETETNSTQQESYESYESIEIEQLNSTDFTTAEVQMKEI